MPVIKSAKKKLRQDRKREIENDRMRNLVKSALRKTKKNPSKEEVLDAMRIIDKAAKRNIFHKNKAARLKSTISKVKIQDKKPSKTVSSKQKKKA